MDKEMGVVLLKLVVLSVVAAAVLGAIYIPTQVQLKIYQQEQKELALVDVMPLADHFDPVKSGDEILFYRALDADNNLVGYSFFHDQSGSQDMITIAGGIDTEYKVTGVKIMSHAETPGLGAKITESAFTDQFIGVAQSDLMLSKDGGAIDSITGATVSSVAIIDGIQVKILEIKANK
ncbi:MAG: FMN-binding protein [Methanosarcinales archaeon]|jgi:electron transport complex protein RnfG|nr:FMN-binding protein [Methanosarcinales archaeon]MRG76149.1 FMN-binding protein [ANME-2 cluster archaeon]